MFPLQCFLELLGTVLLSYTADSPLSSADPVVHFLSVPARVPAPCVHQDHLSLGRLCFLQGQLQPEHLWTGGDLTVECVVVDVHACVQHSNGVRKECATNKDRVGYSVWGNHDMWEYLL